MQKIVFFSVFFFPTLVATFIVANNTKVFYDQKRVLGISTTQAQSHPELPSVSDEKAYWIEVVEDHPTYRDGYIELSMIENKLGNKQAAREYLEKAILTDPNWVNIGKFKKILEE